MSDAGSDDLDEEKGQNLGEYEGERNEREQRHGQGRALLPNGDTYEGLYENGQRNGTGTYRFKNGARYTGEWLKNLKHGQGTFIYPDGSKYEGCWVDDQRSGTGKFSYVNGDTYEGEWREHKRHGYGTYTYADTGSRYVGTWKDGVRSGHGELVHANHKFVGKFHEDKPQGSGKYIFDVGCMQIGEYVIVEQPSDKAGADEEDLRQVPKWRAKGISEVILDAENAESRSASVAPETARVDGSPPPPPVDSGDAEEALDQPAAEDGGSHADDTATLDTDQTLQPPQPTSNDAALEDEDADVADEEVED